LTLMVVPALLAREPRARKRGLRRVLELHVDHDDGGRERHLVLVLDHVRPDRRLRPEADVVDPYLPELAGAVVDVRVRDTPRLLVDEEDALAVRVLRQLRDAFERIDVPLLPLLVEGPVDLLVPLHRVVLTVQDADDVALTE